MALSMMATIDSARILIAPGALVAALSLAACGGGSKSTTVRSTNPTTSSTQTTPAVQPLAQKVEVVKGRTPAASTATAKVGDEVEFRTNVPRLQGSTPVPVEIRLGPGRGATWRAQASVMGQTATATLTTAGGKRLPLLSLHYACVLPPLPTICPPRAISAHGQSLKMRFQAKPSTPISLLAIVGPAGGAPAQPASSGAQMPAYSVRQEVGAVKPGTPSKTVDKAFALTAMAHPGDLVELKTLLTGVAGAPQMVTLTFDQGPGKTLTVSAAVRGGTAAHATVNATAPIALVEPRYTCYLPPTPTFCPATRITSTGGRYSLTFPATPHTPIKVITTARAG